MIDVERSSEAPASLARRTSWSGDDVVGALHRDFHAKCYLCEAVIGMDFEVDHRLPRAADPEGGLLFPGPDRVEERLIQAVDPLSSINLVRCNFEAVDEMDRAAVNTGQELTRLHHYSSKTAFRARVRTHERLEAIRLLCAEVLRVESRIRALRRHRD